MYINTEIADKYQDFFNFFSQEHNLILTIEQMQEILSEAQKLESKLSQHDVIKSVCNHDFGHFNQFTRCRKCGII